MHCLIKIDPIDIPWQGLRCNCCHWSSVIDLRRVNPSLEVLFFNWIVDRLHMTCNYLFSLKVSPALIWRSYWEALWASSDMNWPWNYWPICSRCSLPSWGLSSSAVCLINVPSWVVILHSCLFVVLLHDLLVSCEQFSLVSTLILATSVKLDQVVYKAQVTFTCPFSSSLSQIL